MHIGSDNRNGNNGQIQLWQFLLEILTDQEYSGVIEWVSFDDNNSDAEELKIS